jgi:hypothetical protein
LVYPDPETGFVMRMVRGLCLGVGRDISGVGLGRIAAQCGRGALPHRLRLIATMDGGPQSNIFGRKCFILSGLLWG